MRHKGHICQDCGYLRTVELSTEHKAYLCDECYFDREDW